MLFSACRPDFTPRRVHAMHRRSGSCGELVTVLNDQIASGGFFAFPNSPNEEQQEAQRRLMEFITGFDLYDPTEVERVVCRITGIYMLLYFVPEVVTLFTKVYYTVNLFNIYVYL